MLRAAVLITHRGKGRHLNSRGSMKEPGLDGRHRDKSPPKTGEIQQKRGDTLNKILPRPIEGFRADTKLETMRKATGQVSVEKVRQAAAKMRK
jgi:hypothetical protein